MCNYKSKAFFMQTVKSLVGWLFVYDRFASALKDQGQAQPATIQRLQMRSDS
jgi:hypothetical protein